MKYLSLIALLVIPSVVLADCLEYEPSISTISGVLVKETFAGRPNYESIEEGDEIEAYFFIKMPKSFCVRAAPNEEIHSEHENIKIVQLVFLADSQSFYNSLRPSLGSNVACKGTLLSAITAHHRSRVLLSVSECEKGINRVVH